MARKPRSPGLVPLKMETQLKRFMKKVKTGTHHSHCWRWTGGSGFTVNGKKYDPLRASWILHQKDTDEDTNQKNTLWKDHEIVNSDSCTVSPCLNPMHMALGEKIDPEDWKKEANKDFRAKLSEEDVRDIRYALNVLGESQVALAKRFQVSPSTTQKIAAGLAWQHVTDE